jgi:hypothetical protein
VTSRVRIDEYRFFVEKAYFKHGAGEWVNFKEYLRLYLGTKFKKNSTTILILSAYKLLFYFGHVSYFIILYQLVPLITLGMIKQKKYENASSQPVFGFQLKIYINIQDSRKFSPNFAVILESNGVLSKL